MATPRSLEEHEHIAIEVHDRRLEGISDYDLDTFLMDSVSRRHLRTLDCRFEFLRILFAHEGFEVSSVEFLAEHEIFVSGNVGDHNSREVFDAELLFHAGVLVVIEVEKRLLALEVSGCRRQFPDLFVLIFVHLHYEPHEVQSSLVLHHLVFLVDWSD